MWGETLARVGRSVWRVWCRVTGAVDAAHGRHKGSYSGVLARRLAAPRSSKSNGDLDQTLACREITAGKEMRCADHRDGWQWRWRRRQRTRSKVTMMEEHASDREMAGC